jgi:hypothetical protein
MSHTARLISLLLLATSLTGCATDRHWAVSGSERDEGLVRVSYEFPEDRDPALSDLAAAKLALQRCEGWGYDDAEPIAGQLRQCSSMDKGNCDLWKVTREYQCTRDPASFASQLAR